MPRIAAVLLSALSLLSPPVALPGAAQAQGGQISFGAVNADRNQPLEVRSDNLSVDQDAGIATYSGNVLARQGNTRLAAPRISVYFSAGDGEIRRIEATGGVTLISGPDAAEAQTAVYTVTSGMIDMRGEVLLVRDTEVVTGEHLIVDTRAGTARISGRVRTILQPGN